MDDCSRHQKALMQEDPYKKLYRSGKRRFEGDCDSRPNKQQKAEDLSNTHSKMQDSWNPVVKLKKLPEELVQAYQGRPQRKTSAKQLPTVLKPQVSY